MENEWATSQSGRAATNGLDLHLDVAGPGLRDALTRALRDAVRTGRLAPGSRLPSSRSLAVDLGVARNTVADAYADLTAEGWLVAVRGSGTRVADRARPRRAAPTATEAAATLRFPAHGLLPGAPNLAEFPRTKWLSAARRALATAPHDAFGYGDPLGRLELRTALADYLARARGVEVTPSGVVICAGFHQGLTLLAHALKARRARTVAVEAYSFEMYRDILRNNGLAVAPVSLDEHGARIDELASVEGIGAVLLTPAHQYPTGAALRPARRNAAVEWARHSDGVLLEDDYDGEFRYDREPVGALQGLDPDRIVYFGSASKSLAPGLRLAWMVPPKTLIPAITAAKGDVDWSSALEQLTLADFITTGAYDRHIRSTRLRYRRRRDELVAALADRAPRVRVTGVAAGLQAVVELPLGTEVLAVQAAAARGLAVKGLSDFRFDVPGAEVPERDALVIGYTTPTDSAWTGALHTLCSVLQAVTE
ncbi:GntR-family protein transcriptional regulator [uncultured Mycobacterium sp.]|uniref:GntR-family protein transcriptional regulator n=1 Tax=uncultured Mycobacterium sp. TaxID=171292 RepID=A0A1Y5PGT9_9MYCO|nr:GntR-family protein transcriptional regulator [uncultured Mycobacterium sp.]